MIPHTFAANPHFPELAECTRCNARRIAHARKRSRFCTGGTHPSGASYRMPPCISKGPLAP